MTTVPSKQAPTTSPAKRPEASNLLLRLLTGLIALPIVLAGAVAGGWWFVLIVAPLTGIGVMEFCLLGRTRDVEGNAFIGGLMGIAVVMGVHLEAPVLWLGPVVVGVAATFAAEVVRAGENGGRAGARALMTLAAVLYVAFPASLLVATRDMPRGLVWLLLILFMTWGTDSFAYIGGRLWGRRKLAPAISPRKTVEGAVVGLASGALLGAVVLVAGGVFRPVTIVLLVAGPLLAIAGDLTESWLKRAFLIKDSHLLGLDILPGHGGVLDRVDGLIPVAVFTYAFLLLTGLGG